MDLRVKKTKNSIVSAFLELRAQKPLEKITVKELAEAAMINKATFYLHYKDIYDLSESLELEVVQSIMNDLTNAEKIFTDTAVFTKELTDAYVAQSNLIHTLFSGSNANQLPQRIEESVKEFVFEKYPHLRDDMEYNVMLSFSIYGGYYAFIKNSHYGVEPVSELIGALSEAVRTKIEP